jgi:hypothetical protein
MVLIIIIAINCLNIIIFFRLMFGLVRFYSNGYNALTLNGDYVDYAYSGN